jgi:hypothetical protein
MLLSVVSALARADVDPWQEAAKLARLPVEAATQRLASLIEALPDWSFAPADIATIAARLIRLLPRRTGTVVPSPEPVHGVAAKLKSSRVIVALVFMILMAFVFGLQFITTGHLPPQVDRSDAPVSAVSPRPAPPNTGQ